MKKDRDILLFIAHGGMELTWLYAWATFLATAIMHRPFPLPEASGTFVLAVLLCLVARRMRLRVIAVLGLQILGFLLAAFRLVYAFNYQVYAFFDKGWLLDFFGKTRAPQEWLILVVILLLSLVFWLAGVMLTRRSAAYLTIGVRFDYGVGAFFVLFILKSLLLVKGGVDVKETAPILLLFPFLIFSLLTLSLARNSDTAQRHFLAGYRGVGMLTSFTVVVLAFGSALVLFCMPYMQAAADAGHSVLKSVAGPLLPHIEQLLRFIFKARYWRQSFSTPAAEEETTLDPSGESSWWQDLFMGGLGGGLIGLLLLAGLILGALGLWYLLRWLFSRPSEKMGEQIHWQGVLGWAQRLWGATCRCLQGAVQRLTGHPNAVQLYRTFLRWGRRSGLPHILWETPAEYGSRIRKQFPFLSAEIGGIVDAFNLAVYGEKHPDDDQMARVRHSWRKLRSPRYWPARMKSWFFQGKRRVRPKKFSQNNGPQKDVKEEGDASPLKA